MGDKQLLNIDNEGIIKEGTVKVAAEKEGTVKAATDKEGTVNAATDKEGIDKDEILKERSVSDLKQILGAGKKYAYWLNSIPGIGNRTIQVLRSQYGCAQTIYELPLSRLKDSLTSKQLSDWEGFTSSWDMDGEYARLAGKDIKFLSLEDKEYPERLRQIPDAPFGIFYKGHLPADKILSVAVVGARECSEYGTYVASQLGNVLGQRGIQVISGMARGIDGISQKSAMEAGGESFAVLGCSPDICYPAQNKDIYGRLLTQGGILSLCPPGTKPQPQLFPPRNRIVSGLADVVVVIEARQKSGTLITVDMALEQGREVYAVPGRLTDRLSDGCNRLIRQGAGILLSPEEFLKELSLQFPHKLFGPQTTENQNQQQSPRLMQEERTAQTHPLQLSPMEQSIMSHLDFYPKTIEQIKESLPPVFTHQQLSLELMQLCIKGAVTSTGQGYFRKNAL